MGQSVLFCIYHIHNESSLMFSFGFLKWSKKLRQLGDPCPTGVPGPPEPGDPCPIGEPEDPCPTGVPGPPATRGKTQLLNTTLGGLRVLTPVPRSWWGPPSPPDALDPPSPAWVFPRPLPPAPIPSPASFRKPGEQAGHACIPVPAVQRLAIACLTAAFSLCCPCLRDQAAVHPACP